MFMNRETGRTSRIYALFPRYLVFCSACRLNLSQSFSQSEVKVTPRKRKRVDDSFVQEAQTSSAYSASSRTSGAVEVSEVDGEGKFVRVKNISEKVRPAAIMSRFEIVFEDLTTSRLKVKQ